MTEVQRIFDIYRQDPADWIARKSADQPTPGRPLISMVEVTMQGQYAISYPSYLFSTSYERSKAAGFALNGV